MATRVIKLAASRKRVKLSPSARDRAEPLLGLQNRDVLDGPGLASVDLGLDVPKLRLEVALIRHHADLARLVARSDDSVCIFDGRHQRLFAADVASGFQALQDLSDVLRVRGGDHDRVRLDSAQHFAEFRERRGVCRHGALLAHHADLIF